MKVWITKYALSKGIFGVDGEVSNSTGRMISYRLHGSYQQYAHGHDWHKTKESAIKRAENMRVKRIASLRKQIEKLESLTFTEDV